MRQGFRDILCNEAWTKALRRVAMQPDRRASGFEGGHALSEQSRHNAGQHVAGTSGGEPGRRVRVDGGPAVGAAITVSAPLRITMAPDCAAAVRARSIFDPATPGKSLVNSPS